MSQLSQLLDFSSLDAGISGRVLTNPYELAMRLGWSSAFIWGMQSMDIDQQVESFLSQWIPGAVSEAVSTAIVCGASDLLGAEARRIIGY